MSISKKIDAPWVLLDREAAKARRQDISMSVVDRIGYNLSRHHAVARVAISTLRELDRVFRFPNCNLISDDISLGGGSTVLTRAVTRS